MLWGTVCLCVYMCKHKGPWEMGYIDRNIELGVILNSSIETGLTAVNLEVSAVHETNGFSKYNPKRRNFCVLWSSLITWHIIWASLIGTSKRVLPSVHSQTRPLHEFRELCGLRYVMTGQAGAGFLHARCDTLHPFLCSLKKAVHSPLACVGYQIDFSIWNPLIVNERFLTLLNDLQERKKRGTVKLITLS